MERKIIICTTFREFDDSENAKIQHLFLKSIKEQNYFNYMLVVTTFGEKNVERVLKQEFGNKVVCYEKSLSNNYRYSLSAVFLNGLNMAIDDRDSILLWCTCDIIFKPQYFSTINSLYKDDVVGTSHPNLLVSSVKELEHNDIRRQNMYQGFDILFFATKIFDDLEIRKMLEKYYFYDWGVFEHFLIGIALKYSHNRINLVNYADVLKIENDREASNDTKQFLTEAHRRNWNILQKCIAETKMSDKVNSLWLCHHCFRIKKFTFNYLQYALEQNLNYLIRIKGKSSCRHLVKKMFT